MNTMNHVDLEEIHFQISSKTAPSYPIDWSKSQVSSVVMRLSLELFSQNLDTRGIRFFVQLLSDAANYVCLSCPPKYIRNVCMCSTVAQQDGNQQF